MEPLATAAYVMIAAVYVEGLLVGAVAGAIAWAIKRNHLWLGLVAAGGYLAVSRLQDTFSLKGAVAFGVPPLVFTFLVSWLTARHLEVRRRFRTIWACLLAVCCALIVGIISGFLFRVHIWAPVAFASGASVLLLLVSLFPMHRRQAVQQ
jgi:hypothetical protein